MDRTFKQVYYPLVTGSDIFALRGDRRIFPMTRKVPLARGEDYAYLIQNIGVREIVANGSTSLNTKLAFEPYTYAFRACPVLHITPSLYDLIAHARATLLGIKWMDLEKGLPPSQTQYDDISIIRYLERAGYLASLDIPELSTLEAHIHPVERLKETMASFGKMMRVALVEGGAGGLHYWDNDLPARLQFVIDTYHNSGTPGSAERSCGINLNYWRKTIDTAGIVDTYYSTIVGLTDSNHQSAYYDFIPLRFTLDYQKRNSGTLLVGFSAYVQKRDYEDDYVRSVKFLMNYPLQGSLDIRKSLFDTAITIGRRLVGFDPNIIRSGISTFTLSVSDVVYIYDFNNTTLTITN